MFLGHWAHHGTWFDTPALKYQNMSKGKEEKIPDTVSDRIKRPADVSNTLGGTWAKEKKLFCQGGPLETVSNMKCKCMQARWQAVCVTRGRSSRLTGLASIHAHCTVRESRAGLSRGPECKGYGSTCAKGTAKSNGLMSSSVALATFWVSFFLLLLLGKELYSSKLLSEWFTFNLQYKLKVIITLDLYVCVCVCLEGWTIYFKSIYPT